MFDGKWVFTLLMLVQEISDQDLVGDTRSCECKAHFDFYFGEEVKETSTKIPIKMDTSRAN